MDDDLGNQTAQIIWRLVANRCSEINKCNTVAKFQICSFSEIGVCETLSSFEYFEVLFGLNKRIFLCEASVSSGITSCDWRHWIVLERKPIVNAIVNAIELIIMNWP